MVLGLRNSKVGGRNASKKLFLIISELRSSQNLEINRTSDLLLENLGIRQKQEFFLLNFNTILRLRLHIENSLLFKEAIFKLRVIS